MSQSDHHLNPVESHYALDSNIIEEWTLGLELSGLFESSAQADIPSFTTSEISLGSFLGKGGFCMVHEISRIDANDNVINYGDDCDLTLNESHKEVIIKKKNNMAQDISRKKGRKYAIKYLRQYTTMSPQEFHTGLVDLIVETKILSVLDHPNIIELHGFNRQELFGPQYFIVVERLQSTLDEVIEDWRVLGEKKQYRKAVGRENKIHVKPTLQNKLNIATNISNGLSYTHKMGVIHRDIKPENIGLNDKGCIKIFDFSLATEMKEEDMNVDGLYNLTGKTGSIRYMAPEMMRRDPYDASIDIYSFGILLWEIFSHQKAFKGLSMSMLEFVVDQCNRRPEIDTLWPVPVQTIIQNCWAQDNRNRANSDKVYQSLLQFRDGICRPFIKGLGSRKRQKRIQINPVAT